MPYYGDERQDRPDPYRRMGFGVVPKVHESVHMKAQGNLGYLDFIRLLQGLWEQSHPEIPLYATGTDNFPTYPNIIYGLEIRRPFETEPKFRTREVLRTGPDEDELIIYAQRFTNIVTFKVTTRENPQLAEEIIEMFEDWMIEYTPIFKQLGLSEIRYAQRMPDEGSIPRAGRHVIQRTVAYQVVTEKIVTSSAWKIQNVLVDARKFLADATPAFDPDDPTLDHATPINFITDQFGSV